MKIEDYLTPREYVINGSGKTTVLTNDPSSFIDEVKISWRGKNRGRGIEHWAIISWDGTCMTKDGKWEWEPMGSRRDDAFIERCRFDSVEEALETYLKWKKTRTFLSICPNCNIEFESKKEPKEKFYNRDELCPSCFKLLNKECVMKETKNKKAKIVVWGGKLLVDYKDASKTDSSYLIETKEDITDLVKELTNAGYIKE